jgi:hypothetical protein
VVHLQQLMSGHQFAVSIAGCFFGKVRLWSIDEDKLGSWMLRGALVRLTIQKRQPAPGKGGVNCSARGPGAGNYHLLSFFLSLVSPYRS